MTERDRGQEINDTQEMGVMEITVRMTEYGSRGLYASLDRTAKELAAKLRAQKEALESASGKD